MTKRPFKSFAISEILTFRTNAYTFGVCFKFGYGGGTLYIRAMQSAYNRRCEEQGIYCKSYTEDNAIIFEFLREADRTAFLLQVDAV